MAADATDRYYRALEKKAGQKAARTIKRKWKALLATATTEETGLLLAHATAWPVMKYDSLESIAVSGTTATFKQHYGFEGIKKNGEAMSMVPFDHFGNLYRDSDKALTQLTAEIAEIRGAEITTRIQKTLGKLLLEI